MAVPTSLQWAQGAVESRPAATNCRVGGTPIYCVRYNGIRNLTLGRYIANLFDKYPSVDFREQFGTPIPKEPDDVRRRLFRISAEYKF